MSIKRTVALVAVLLGLFTAAAQADVRPRGGGDVGTPFSGANQKVELADGEHYNLIGTIRIWRDTPHFEVDLTQHPWLASARRSQMPFYPLQGAATYWRRFENMRVKLVVEANGMIVMSGNRGDYVIALYPLLDPVVLKKR